MSILYMLVKLFFKKLIIAMIGEDYFIFLIYPSGAQEYIANIPLNTEML